MSWGDDYSERAKSVYGDASMHRQSNDNYTAWVAHNTPQSDPYAERERADAREREEEALRYRRDQVLFGQPQPARRRGLFDGLSDLVISFLVVILILYTAVAAAVGAVVQFWSGLPLLGQMALLAGGALGLGTLTAIGCVTLWWRLRRRYRRAPGRAR